MSSSICARWVEMDRCGERGRWCWSFWELGRSSTAVPASRKRRRFRGRGNAHAEVCLSILLKRLLAPACETSPVLMVRDVSQFDSRDSLPFSLTIHEVFMLLFGATETPVSTRMEPQNITTPLFISNFDSPPALLIRLFSLLLLL